MHSKSDFGPFQIATLKAFLDAPERAPESMGYAEATGFLFCVACAPQMVPPSQWLPVIIDPDNAAETSLDTKQAVMSGLIALYNEMTRQVQQEDVGLPPGCEFADDPIDNLQPGASMSQWANGFREAYLWLEQMWSDYVPQDLKEEFGYQLTVLCFFCHRQMATELYAGVDKTQDITFEAMAAQMKRLFPDAMRGVAALGMSIQEVLDQRNAAEQQPVTRGSKVGRNDPCSCGSGVKYKKCCGAPNA